MPTPLIKRRSPLIELFAAAADMAGTLCFFLFAAVLALAFAAVWVGDRFAEAARDYGLPIVAALIVASLVALSLALAPDSPGYAPAALDAPAHGSR